MAAVVQTVTTMLALANRAQHGDLKAAGDAFRALCLGQPYRTYAGNPSGNATPDAIGQMLFDTTNAVFYKAVGLTSTSWASTTSPASGLGVAGNLAATGTVQGNAAAIVTRVVHVTAADAAKGVLLPAPVAGTVIFVKNSDAANAVLKVYAAGNATINAIAAASALSMAAKTTAAFFATSGSGGDTGTYFSLPLLPS